MTKPTHILYFAWLREKIGASDETLAVPDDVCSVGDLMAWLARRSPGHAAAFENAACVRCAIDQDFVSVDTSITNAREIAFFPPVTGG